VEDINWRASRSLDRSLVAALAGGDWLRHAQNLLNGDDRLRQDLAGVCAGASGGALGLLGAVHARGAPVR
jgi:hypothetical protein